MCGQEAIKCMTQPVIFEERDEGEQDGSNKQRVGNVRRNGVTLRPGRKRPEPLERCTDQKAQKQLSKATACKEHPHCEDGNAMTKGTPADPV